MVLPVVRKLIVAIALVAALFAAVIVYLIATTPSTGAGARLPLTADQKALLTSVPDDAEALAFVPKAAALEKKLLANPVTRDLMARWRNDQPLPHPWMVGGADLVAWRRGKVTSYALHLDPVRAFLVRIYLMFASESDARWDRSTIVINSDAQNPTPAAVIDSWLALADASGTYDALVVQRDTGHGSYPPIARPAFTTITITPAEILLVSRAAAQGVAPVPPPFQARFPQGGMLSVTFASPPRTLRDLDRVLGGTISGLGDQGGTLVLYDVNAGTLFPRPKGVIALTGESARSMASSDAAKIAASVGEVRDTGTELLVSLDRTSVPLYIKDRFEPAPWPANVWSARIDPKRLVPVLEDLGDSAGLRIASGRVYRSTRDLRKWIGQLSRASEIDAALSTSGTRQELRVRIVSK
jgi:hypothetical protein